MSETGDPLSVFLIAGEASGDRLGAALIRGLRRSAGRPLELSGVGGAAMRAEGLQSLFDIEDIAVMGVAEVLPRLRTILSRIDQTAAKVVEARPDIVVSIDAPDFGLRVAKKARAACARGGDRRPLFAHYVAPSVWAWRPGRAKKYAARLDHLLALLPFEPPYFQAEGLSCDFVGHPVVGEKIATHREAAAFRQAHEIGDAPLMLVLPGSRRSEVARLSDVFGDAVARFARTHPDLRVVIPAAGPVADAVIAQTQGWTVRPIVLDPRAGSREEGAAMKRAAFAAADVALAASGTVSLELAAASLPMVIAYRMNWLSFRLIKAMALIDTVTLVNLVSDTRVVPEFLGPDCTADKIAGGLAHVFAHPEDQKDAMALTMERLGKGGESPGLRAARAVLAKL